MPDAPRTLLAHPGTQHSYRLARELARRSLLSEFWTGLAFAQAGIGATIAKHAQLLPGARGIATRIVPGVPSRLLRTRPLDELRAIWRLRRGESDPAVLHERNERFQRSIPRSSILACDAAIGFDTSSWILAQRCRDARKPFFLDRSIAHPAALTRIMQGLRRRYPDWVDTVEPRMPSIVDAERVEHDLATRIVVGGSFARSTLVEEGIEASRIRVNPYGVDWAAFAPGAGAPQSARPFRFLFAGSFTARKGAPVLLDAWRAIADGEVELWVAGSVGPRVRALVPDLPGLRLLGAVAPARMPQVYAACDILVLPSLFEGFGLVILEALAAGLQVIATRSTGAVDVVDDPALGDLVEAGSAESLAEAMRRRRNSPPSREAVRARACSLRQRFDWCAYGERWAQILAERD